MSGPESTVTLFFADIEGSTRLLDLLGQRYAEALAAYRQLLSTACQDHGGRPVGTEGDGYFAVFPRAREALAAAIAAQQTAERHPWPEGARVRIRMALHTGEPVNRDVGYVGMDVHRAARICSAGHGGQILLSLTTASLVEQDLPSGVSLKDLGSHRLKDLQQPEKVFQVVHETLPAHFPPLKSLDNVANNLPRQLTSFIGRERDMVEVKRRFAGTCLLTLTGTGGAGKTRLAIQLAADMLDEFHDGVWLVELAPLSDPAFLAQSIASVLGIREVPGMPLLSTVVEYIGTKNMLLVLDNCEHVVAACAEVAETLLWSCPHLRILATSREALGIPAEVVWRVPSLSLPVLEQLPPTSELIQYGAVRLFVERAAAVRSAFSLTDQNAPAVVAVCQRLDGIPLAIELAAARVPAMTVGQIAARLDDRFRLLTRGRGAALPRHQTLRAVMDWSYQLLADSEKLILRRLSVFAGGFTLEAAEAVCKGDEVSDLGVLDLLTQLVTKSLVLMDERDGDMRYRFLETVRQYAMDMLRTSGELPAIRGRHYLWFLSLAQQAAPELRRRAQSMWMDRLESEHDNFRAALEWTRDAGTADDAMRLAHALVWFWSVRGYIGEGRERLAAALSRSDAAEPTPTRAEALWAAGILARQQGDYGSARRLYEECLEIRRRLGDRRGVAEALNSLGLVVREQGDYAAAYAMHSESLQIRRSLGDDLGIANALTNLGLVVAAQGDYAAAERFHEQSLTIKRRVADELSLAYTMNNLGDVAYHRGDYDKARALYDESLSIKRRIGDKFGIAYSLRSLANVMYRQGDHASARALYAESLERRRTLGERSGIAECLEGLAAVATAEGRYERSATLFAAADALRENLGTPVPPADRTEHQRVLADVRASLGQVLFDNAWARGRAMSPEEAWEFASAEGVSQAARRSFPM